MSAGRHSYVPFFPSDWLAGTARMTPMQELVYFRICCWCWDKAEPVPEAELPLMLGQIDDWQQIVETLTAARKLDRSPDRSLGNSRAISEAIKAKDLWERKSRGGKARAAELNGNATSPDGSDANSPDKTPSKTDTAVLTQNQNQNHIPPIVPQGDDDEFFVPFWNFFPKQEGEKAARKAWAKAVADGANPDEIVAGAKRYADQCDGREDRYIKMPAKWLAEERWRDGSCERQPTGEVSPRAVFSWSGELVGEFRKRVRSELGATAWKVWLEPIIPETPGCRTGHRPPDEMLNKLRAKAVPFGVAFEIQTAPPAVPDMARDAIAKLKAGEGLA